jgi:hypothetical protein
VPTAIRTLLEDRELAAGMARRARELVAEHHSQSVAMDRVADAHRTLVGPRPLVAQPPLG